MQPGRAALPRILMRGRRGGRQREGVAMTPTPSGPPVPLPSPGRQHCSEETEPADAEEQEAEQSLVVAFPVLLLFVILVALLV